MGPRVRRVLRRDLIDRLRIRWRIDVVRRFTKDALTDQRLLMAGTEVTRILDVGANVGHLTDAYLEAFPRSHIAAFEVAPLALIQLRRRLGGENRVTIVDKAVSDTTGETVLFHVTPTVGTSSLLKPAGEHSDVIEVLTVRLDDWCAAHGLSGCDILKLDIEGAELQALDGASDMLSRSAIGLIYCEVRLIAETQGGALLHEVAARLATDGYRLHNLYDLVESRTRGTIYANAIFLSPTTHRRIEDQLGDRAFIQRLGHRSASSSGQRGLR